MAFSTPVLAATASSPANAATVSSASLVYVANDVIAAFVLDRDSGITFAGTPITTSGFTGSAWTLRTTATNGEGNRGTIWTAVASGAGTMTATANWTASVQTPEIALVRVRADQAITIGSTFNAATNNGPVDISAGTVTVSANGLGLLSVGIADGGWDATVVVTTPANQFTNALNSSRNRARWTTTAGNSGTTFTDIGIGGRKTLVGIFFTESASGSPPVNGTRTIVADGTSVTTTWPVTSATAPTATVAISGPHTQAATSAAVVGRPNIAAQMTWNSQGTGLAWTTPGGDAVGATWQAIYTATPGAPVGNNAATLAFAQSLTNGSRQLMARAPTGQSTDVSFLSGPPTLTLTYSDASTQVLTGTGLAEINSAQPTTAFAFGGTLNDINAGTKLRPIWEFPLPTIPSGQTITAAAFQLTGQWDESFDGTTQFVRLDTCQWEASQTATGVIPGNSTYTAVSTNAGGSDSDVSTFDLPPLGGGGEVEGAGPPVNGPITATPGGTDALVTYTITSTIPVTSSASISGAHIASPQSATIGGSAPNWTATTTFFGVIPGNSTVQVISTNGQVDSDTHAFTMPALGGGGEVGDTVAPTLVITNDVIGTATGAFTATFTFSEPVTGFVVGDVGLTNGTAGTFTSVNGSVYTLVVTPPANATGTTSINVAAGVCQDAAGNLNVAATALNQAYNTTGSNLAPTDITLSATQVAENSPNGAVIGFFSTIDPDSGNTHAYTLPVNAGGRFGISGANLVVSNGSLLNFEAGTSHAITVRSTDQGGLFFEKTFTVLVSNILESLTIQEPITGATGALLTITVLNEGGTGESGVVVTWQSGNGGVISGTTNGSGQATITLGAPGAYTLLATKGAVSDTAPVSVSGFDSNPPTITLSASSTNITQSGNLILTANYAALSGVDRVQWLVNGVPFALSTIAPAAVSGSIAKSVLLIDAADNGTVTYTARASARNGVSSTSSGLSVTVNIAGIQPQDKGLADMIEIPRKETARGIFFDLTVTGSSAPLVGATVSIVLSKDQGPLAPGTGVVMETNNPGKYIYRPSQEDVNAEGPLLIYPSAPGASPVPVIEALVVTPYGRR
jgi:hypothetical protein